MTEDEIRDLACACCGLGLVMTGGRYFLVVPPTQSGEKGTVAEVALLDTRPS